MSARKNVAPRGNLRISSRPLTTASVLQVDSLLAFVTLKAAPAPLRYAAAVTSPARVRVADVRGEEFEGAQRAACAHPQGRGQGRARRGRSRRRRQREGAPFRCRGRAAPSRGSSPLVFLQITVLYPKQ